jgi:hypothetical protein
MTLFTGHLFFTPIFSREGQAGKPQLYFDAHSADHERFLFATLYNTPE